MGKLFPIELKEPYGSEKARGENGSDAENLVAHDEATEHLSIHALEGIRAKDGFVGACEDVVRVEWSFPELLALVVARQHRTRH